MLSDFFARCAPTPVVHDAHKKSLRLQELCSGTLSRCRVMACMVWIPSLALTHVGEMKAAVLLLLNALTATSPRTVVSSTRNTRATWLSPVQLAVAGCVFVRGLIIFMTCTITSH